MNRRTRKRDRKFKTIKPGMDASYWGLIKKALPWLIVGMVVWGLALKLMIWVINYNITMAGGG